MKRRSSYGVIARFLGDHLHEVRREIRPGEPGTGQIRVGNTRTTLDVLLGDYRRGMAPKEIVDQLDSLTVADVYGALAYYHRHKDELDAYLQDRAEDSARRQREIEATQPTFDQVKSRI